MLILVPFKYFYPRYTFLIMCEVELLKTLITDRSWRTSVPAGYIDGMLGQLDQYQQITLQLMRN